MNLKAYRISEGILGLMMAGYALAVLAHADLAANLLSPFIIGSIGIFLAHFARKAERANFALFLLAGYFLSWAAADVLWAVYEHMLGIDPNGLDLFLYLYIVPNLFLAVTCAAFLLTQVRIVNRMQFLLDLVVTVLVAVSFIWILFYQGSAAEFSIMTPLYFSTFLYVVTDAIAISSLFLWFILVRVRGVPLPVWIAAGGLLLYAAVDMGYVYQEYNGIYIPNSLIDIGYILSFVVVAQGMLLAARQLFLVAERRTGASASGSVLWGGRLRDLPEAVLTVEQTRGFGSAKAILLIFAPLLIGFIQGIDVRVMVYMISLVLVHQIISAFLQNIAHKRVLLQQEKRTNELLEERIGQRTRELREANARLDQLSRTDAITGLNNRRHFLETLDAMLGAAAEKECVAVFFMDLDRFKAVNDSYGHDVGDRLLVEVGCRLAGVNIPDSVIARLGGDEFVLAVRGEYERDQFEPMAWQLLSLFQSPIKVDPHQFRVSLSIGITIYPLDCAERDAMMRNADIAMYQAKESGLNQYVFFSRLLNKNVHRENELELLLRKASLLEEFSLQYQPQFSLKDGSLVGAEALLRWNSPEIGPVSPGEFIPIAESNGLIVPLGEWVLRRTMRQAAEWNARSPLPLRLGVNLSPRQLVHPGFDRTLQRVIEVTGADPHWLDLEITEHSAMQYEGHHRELFQKIAGTGATFSIDDFGTGYSSLSYLEQYPIHRLKIARELIEKITTDEGSYQIVKAIIALADAMDIVTIAEGVETEEQRGRLIELGCGQVQGFLYARPMPADEFEKRFLTLPAGAAPAADRDGPSVPARYAST